jgi:hypothetical protein
MSDENVMVEDKNEEISPQEEEIPKIEISKKRSNPKRLNEQDKIRIIAHYIHTKESPEGYSVTEDSKGNFHVKTIRIIIKKDQHLRQKQRFEKKISQIDEEIKSLDQEISISEENILNEPKKNIKKDIPKKNIPKKKKRVSFIESEEKKPETKPKEEDEEPIMIEEPNEESIEEDKEQEYKIQEPMKPKITRKEIKSPLQTKRDTYNTTKISTKKQFIPRKLTFHIN